MAEGHVIGYWPQVARSRQNNEALFMGNDIVAQQQSPVVLTMDMLEHLALAAATGPLVPSF